MGNCKHSTGRCVFITKCEPGLCPIRPLESEARSSERFEALQDIAEENARPSTLGYLRELSKTGEDIFANKLDEALDDLQQALDEDAHKLEVLGAFDVTPTLTEDSSERKLTPICEGVFDYFPLALAAVARLSMAGNDKHNPGEPLHWSKGKSTDHPNCIARHLLTRFEIDPETGEAHAVALAWRALALLQIMEEARLIGCSYAERIKYYEERT